MKGRILLLAMAMMPVFSFAQDDFGTILSVEAEKKINKKVSLDLEAEMRTRDDVKEVDRWSGGVSVSYKLLSWLKVSAGYVFIYDNNERVSYYDADDKKVINGVVKAGDPKKCAQYWGPRHRFNVSLTGSYKLGQFGFSLRERWQYTYRPEHTVDQRWSYYDEDWDGDEHTYSAKGKNVLRSRFQVTYKINDFPATPFANVELFNEMKLDKRRYNVGAEWKKKKKNAVTMYYRYQHVYDKEDNEADRHFVGLGYTLKF